MRRAHTYNIYVNNGSDKMDDGKLRVYIRNNHLLAFQLGRPFQNGFFSLGNENVRIFNDNGV